MKRWNRRILSLAAILLLAAAVSCSKKEEATAERTFTVRIVAGPELRAYLSSMKELFYMTNPKLEDGSKVSLDFITELGVPASRRIASGELKAEGWIAPSSSLVAVTNQSVRNLGAKQIECTQLFGSPVVVALPGPYESEIGAHDQQFDWNKIFAGSPDNGHGGTIRYSHASPQGSVSGFAALTQLAEFAAGADAATSSTQLQWSDGLAQKLRDYEAKISQYSLSESYLLERSADSAPPRLRFTLTTEQQVALFNQHRGSSPPALRALYPERGAVWADYTLCQSDADWVTPTARSAMKIVKHFFSTDSAQRAVAEHGFRPSISKKVNPNVLGANLGIAINLPASSFSPVSAEFAEKLLGSWEDLIRPVALVIAVDTSGSMEGDSIRGVKDGLREFIARLPAHTKAAITSFGGESHLNAPLTEDMGAIMPALDGLQAQGGSAAYDGIKFAVDTVSVPELARYRHVVVVITDGEGKNSEISQPALQAYLNEKQQSEDLDLTIVTIKREGSEYPDLKEIAKNSGATYRESSINDMPATFQELLKNL